MPRKPIDYSNTHFYKICCKDLDIKDIYVGHTTDFRKSKSQHKDHCCNETAEHYHYAFYKFIRQNGGWSTWDMILIETKQCSDALDARRIEREHVEQLQASLNRCLPGRTQQEYEKRYGEGHKEQVRERKKQYAETHKDQRADYWKRYYEGEEGTQKSTMHR